MIQNCHKQIFVYSTSHEQHWNVKLNSVCSKLALQIRPSRGSWTPHCHRHLPKSWGRGTQSHKHPSRMVPRKRQGCHSSAAAMAKTGCGVERKLMRTPTLAVQRKHLRVLRHATKPFFPGKNDQPSSFMILCQATSFTWNRKQLSLYVHLCLIQEFGEGFLMGH